MANHWKKNLIKIPENIKAKVGELGKTSIVASCTVKIEFNNLLDGNYEHLDIRIVAGQLKFPSRILPNPEIGRYSKHNLYGFEKVYRDLPMVTRSYGMESPNYGDWDKGSHEVIWDREVYQRKFFGPKYLEILIDLVGVDNQNNHVFKFKVDDILCSSQPDFWGNLLFNLNLLQENVGNHDVFATDADINEYLKSLYVNWEVLPPGELEDNVTRILAGLKSNDPKIRQKLVDRFKFLMSMKPQNLVQGTSKFLRYFGGQFASDLVVFENVEYGNAIYVMFSNWEELSQKTRTELLATEPPNYIRIPHTKTWKIKLRRTIIQELKKRRVRG